MKKLLFIFNPRSGKELIRLRLLDILDLFIKQEYEVSVHVTQGQQDALSVVTERAERFDLVVCSGGDGTLNEVVSGLMTCPEDRRPALGYIPSGSTNDFASSLGLKKKMMNAAEEAMEILIKAQRECEERYMSGDDEPVLLRIDKDKQ